MNKKAKHSKKIETVNKKKRQENLGLINTIP